MVLVILWVSVGRCVSVGGGVFVIGRELLLDTFGDGVRRCVFVAVSVILGVTLGVFFMVFVGKAVLEFVAVMRLVLEGVTGWLLEGVAIELLVAVIIGVWDGKVGVLVFVFVPCATAPWGA